MGASRIINEDARNIYSEEEDYLTDNPMRRRPDLSKAKACLNYNPAIDLREGLERLYKWYMQNSVQ